MVTTCYIRSNTKYFVGCGVLFVLVVYMEVVPDPNTMRDRTKAFVDVCHWPKHIKGVY